MSESKFDKSAREAARRRCNEARQESRVLSMLSCLEKALDEIDRVEAENTTLRRRLDGRRTTCLELAETMFAAWAKSPPTAGAMAQWFRKQLEGWWNPTIESFRAAVVKTESENATLHKRIAELGAEVAALRETSFSVEQILGKALGYPPLYPEASTVDDGTVCVGDHVPETIASEAAERIIALRTQVAERGEALEFMAKDARPICLTTFGDRTRYVTYNDATGRTLGRGPTPLAAIQDTMAKKGGARC